MNKETAGLISVRQKQAYAGLCLLAFCRHFNVQQPALFALAKHLFSMLSAVDLPAWEERGTKLELSGFGDPLPEELKQKFPKIIQASAEEIVNCASTIGVVDMYGALTDRPDEYLRVVVRLVTEAGVSVPDTTPLTSLPMESGWGEAVDADKYFELTRSYSDLLSGVVD